MKHTNEANRVKSKERGLKLDVKEENLLIFSDEDHNWPLSLKFNY